MPEQTHVLQPKLNYMELLRAEKERIEADRNYWRGRAEKRAEYLLLNKICPDCGSLHCMADGKTGLYCNECGASYLLGPDSIDEFAEYYRQEQANTAEKDARQ